MTRRIRAMLAGLIAALVSAFFIWFGLPLWVAQWQGNPYFAEGWGFRLFLTMFVPAGLTLFLVGRAQRSGGGTGRVAAAIALSFLLSAVPALLTAAGVLK